MRSARKLRAVPNCPQPETPYKPVVMGCPLLPKGTRIKANAPAGELHAIIRSQSLRTKAGCRAEPMGYIESVAHLRSLTHTPRVTVPPPREPVAGASNGANPCASPGRVQAPGLSMPARAATVAQPPSRTAARVGSPLPSGPVRDPEQEMARSGRQFNNEVKQ